MKSMINITGDAELDRALTQLEKKTRIRVMKPAINFAMTPITKTAKRLVPRRYGFLKKAIKKKVSKDGWNGRVFISGDVVGPNGEIPKKYAHLVEFGTKHTRPRPFLRRAREGSAKECMMRLAQKCRERFNKELSKR